MTKNKNNLNKKEKQEIVSDVKKAIEEARVNFQSKKDLKKIIILTVVLTFVISLGVIYWYFSNNPRNLFRHSIGGFWSSINNNLKATDNVSGTIDISSDVRVGNKELNKYNYKIDYLTDGNNNVFLWETYELNNLLLEVTFSNKDSGYVYIPDLDNKYISLSDNYYNYKNSFAIGEVLNKAFLRAINNYKVSSSKTVFKIDGKLINTHKISLFLKNNDVEKVIDKINDYLKNDVSFKNNYDAMIKKESFETKINNLKNNYQDSNLEINVYTSGLSHSFGRLELIEFKDGVLNSIKITKINDNKYYIIFDDGNSSTVSKYDVSVKKVKDSFIYDVNVQKRKNGNVVLDMDTSIKFMKKSNANGLNTDVNNSVSYDSFSTEEKYKIEEKLKPIKMFKDELFQK